MFPEDGELISVSDAAKYLSVSAKSIRRWAQKGFLYGLKVGIRGDWRFKKSDLQKMINVRDKKI